MAFRICDRKKSSSYYTAGSCLTNYEMALDDLVEYIKNALADDFSEREIKKALRTAGYEDDLIAHAFEVARLAKYTSEPLEDTVAFDSKGFFGRLKELFFTPTNFFKELFLIYTYFLIMSIF